MQKSTHMTDTHLPRIFIGGTGRSGTSIFYEALGRHKQIHVFPQEMRFLVDPGGLKDLVDALTVRYAPAYAREALYYFERLMRVYLTTPARLPYRGFDLAQWLAGEEDSVQAVQGTAPDFYWQRLDQFCAQLTELEFQGNAWQVDPQHEGRAVRYARGLQALRRRLAGRDAVPTRLDLPRNSLKVARYFSQRNDLTTLAAAFVDDLFLHAAHRAGKTTWAEKTPHSIYYLDFLWELFPDSIFVHIKRDPRGVVYSMTKDTWKRAPRNVHDACVLLKNMYDRWFDLKQTLPLTERCYLEPKIEDIAANPGPTLAQIAASCGLPPDFIDLPQFSLERLNTWQKDMDRRDIEVVNKQLADYITGMGYES